ncbi:MAG: two-component regulator propeller domain-containing protein [Bacteroidota bacterium]
MPYNTAVSVATDGTTLYTATGRAFFTYNNSTSEKTPYSKVEGIADVGMTYTAYDVTTSTVILAYTNCNVDLYNNGSFYNIPDIKLKTLTGLKYINHIYTENGLAYLSTGFGVVVIDLKKREIKETYTFIQNSQTIPVNSFTANANTFYAATSNGIYYANKNLKNLQDFSVWNIVNSNSAYSGIITSQNRVYISNADSVFNIVNDTLLIPIYSTTDTIKHIDTGANSIWVCQYNSGSLGTVKKINSSFMVVDSFNATLPVQVVELGDGSVWVADSLQGLKKRISGNQLDFTPPQGPAFYFSSDIFAYNKELWMTHGGHQDNFQPENNSSGLSHFKDETWTIWNNKNYPPFVSIQPRDMCVVTQDNTDGTVYVGAYLSGLLIHKKDSLFTQNNDHLDLIYGNYFYAVSGLAIDQDRNIWINNFGSNYPLVVKTQAGNWYKYAAPSSGATFPHAASGLIIDDYNQKWFYANGGGLVVYNDNNTLDNVNDDASYYYQTGTQNGNLPSNNIYCLLKDKSGAIWVGTDNGIGIINCPGEATKGTCSTELRVVQYDQFAGYLFQNQPVQAMAVDGADRKWVGTNSGVWLLSADAGKAIYHFTQDNSPLPSNNIVKIAVDPITGDVYIGTLEGMVSYRSTATDGATSNQNVTVYPNPISSKYKGTIAIKGLVNNADVRITDIAGQLVYKTTALGGQAIWSGVDYTGRRPQSGVYLVFITNKDGSESYVAKMVFME